MPLPSPATRCATAPWPVRCTPAPAEMREGGGLVGSLGKSGVFPELSLRLISVGEQSGQLDTMLGRVADIYEAALQRQLTGSPAC